MPGIDPKEVQAEFQAVGAKVEVKPDPNLSASRPPPRRCGDVLGAVTKAIRSLYGPKTEIYPVMSDRCERRQFFPRPGLPVYDIDGSWGISPIDERAHGLDERIPVNSMYNDVLYWEMIYRALAG